MGSRVANGSAWLVDCRPVTGDVEILFGFPNVSKKPYNYILRDYGKFPLTESIFLSLNLPVHSTGALNSFSLKKFINCNPPMVFRLYQGPKYKRPHIKLLGSGDITIKEDLHIFSNYTFSWEPKKIVHSDTDCETALEYLLSANNIFNGVKVYTTGVPNGWVSLFSIFGEVPEVALAFGTPHICQKIDIVLKTLKGDKLKKIQRILEGKKEEELCDLDELSLTEEQMEDLKEIRKLKGIVEEA